MFPKIICIIIVLTSFCKANQIAEHNETTLLPFQSDLQPLREVTQRLKEEKEQDSSIQLNKAQGPESLMNGRAKKTYLRSCNEATSTGIHDILITNFSSQPFTVACDAETRGGGWTVILRRMDGSVDFNRTWNAYKNGFGNLDGEFILGLDKIHALTAERNHELLVLLEDQNGFKAFETYKAFVIGNEDEKYVLLALGDSFRGTAGNSLEYHLDYKFSTFDQDNDNDYQNCAKMYTGGWWYDSCFYSKLTGTYNDNRQAMGIIWQGFQDNKHSLKTAVMMIRPKDYVEEE